MLRKAGQPIENIPWEEQRNATLLFESDIAWIRQCPSSRHYKWLCNAHTVDEMAGLWLLVNTLCQATSVTLLSFCSIFRWHIFYRKLMWGHGQTTWFAGWCSTNVLVELASVSLPLVFVKLEALISISKGGWKDWYLRKYLLWSVRYKDNAQYSLTFTPWHYLENFLIFFLASLLPRFKKELALQKYMKTVDNGYVPKGGIGSEWWGIWVVRNTDWSDSPALSFGQHKLTMSSRAGCLTSLGFLTCNQEVTAAPDSWTGYW